MSVPAPRVNFNVLGFDSREKSVLNNTVLISVALEVLKYEQWMGIAFNQLINKSWLNFVSQGNSQVYCNGKVCIRA